MKIEANWLLSSSAHSLLMSTVFCLLTGDHTSPCHLTLVHVHLKANGRNGVPLFSSLSVQVASYCDFLISFGIPHPTIHPLSQKHGNLPGFLPFPHLPHGTNQLSIPAPVYLTDPSCLTHIHCHHCSCTFFRVSSLSGSSFPTCNHLPHHYHESDVVLPLPQRIHGYCLPSGESSDKGTRTCGSPLSVQPVSCLSSHPDRLSQPTQLFAVLYVTLFFPSIPAVVIACLSHCLLITSYLAL